MKFRVTEIFNRSITVELVNRDKYRTQPYLVKLNGEPVFDGPQDRNVFAITGLQPDTEYRLSVQSAVESTRPDTQLFRTRPESALLDVRKFGAVGDGVHRDTAALQAAIYACPEKGTVRVPKGRYLTSPLFLRSSITLWLEEGAVLLGDPDRSHYPVLPGMIPGTDEKSEFPMGTWEGNPLDSFASLITGIGVQEVDIIGPGVIDGNAQNGDWWEDVRTKRTAWRPNTVYLLRCTNIRMQNVTIRNSPSWTLHPAYCHHLRFSVLTIENPADSPNTDGFDPESCSDVRLIGTRISVGDDCIAIKSGKYYMAHYHWKKSTGTVIRNCLFERGHGSVTIGSEIAGGVEEVHVSQCIFDGTDRGVRLKTRRGRGERSLLDGLIFERIEMRSVPMPVTVNMFYYCDPDGHSEEVQDRAAHPVTERTPRIGTIEVRDVVCTGVNASLLCAYGIPEMPVECIVLEHVKASFLPKEERTPYIPVMMDGLDPMEGVGFYMQNVRKAVLEDIRLEGIDRDQLLIGEPEQLESERILVNGEEIRLQK